MPNYKYIFTKNPKIPNMGTHLCGCVSIYGAETWTLMKANTNRYWNTISDVVLVTAVERYAGPKRYEM